jgi:hypothetical protein
MPDSQLVLNGRDREILEALTWRVRLMSVRQVGRTWWAGATDPDGGARARLKALERAGLVQTFTAMARPELELAGPLAVWEVGQAPPDLAALSYRLMSRWAEALRQTQCAVATARAGHLFGGRGGRLPKAQEETHDLHVAGMFLRYRQLRPDLMRHWASEEIVKRGRPKVRGEKLPDAMILAPDSARAVEFGGEYPKEKLAAFHAYCVAEQYPYEIW